jgi:peptide/histidine transporter 3/4
LLSLGSSVRNIAASLIFSTVDDITSRGEKESWVSDNINKGYHKYYWLLSIMSFLSIFYYLVCSWTYGPSIVEASSETEEQLTLNIRANRVHHEQEASYGTD